MKEKTTEHFAFESVYEHAHAENPATVDHGEVLSANTVKVHDKVYFIYLSYSKI